MPGPDHLMTRTADLILRRPGGGADEYGNPLPVETVESTQCHIQQEIAEEREAGNLQRTQWRVFLPAAVPARGWDALALVGESVPYELTGDPWPVINARTGAVSHLEARVRRVDAG